MTSDYNISSSTDIQLRTILELCVEAFQDTRGESIYEDVAQLENLHKQGKLYVASKRKDLAGFLAYEFAGDNKRIKEDYLGRKLSYARNRGWRDVLLKHLEGLVENWGGEASIEYFSNGFTLENFDIQDEDITITHLFVLPEFRRIRIGESLNKRVLEIARERKSKAIYINCVDKPPVVSLYESLGFNTIIRASPSYCDGSAGRMMGLLLD